MNRVHRTSFIAPHIPYEIPKRFRHETDPRKTSRWRFVYNETEGSILGRTPINWCQLLIFYIVFYLSTALLCYICWIGFIPTLSDKQPTVLISQPGFGVQPMISELFEINYKVDDIVKINAYVKQVDILLSKYGQLPEDYFPACTAVDDYGYDLGTPCIFLKVNRIIGFQVNPYDDPGQLPKEAPAQLRELINNLPAEERKERVWVSCQAHKHVQQPTFNYQPHQWVPAATINLNQKVEYEDMFYNKEDYQRVVAVQISDFPHKQKINIHCHLWAKNIVRDEVGDPGVGVVKFSIYID